MTDNAQTQKRATKIATWRIAMFALPTIGAGYMFCLVNLYIMKFATDILLIAPAIMGLIFGISRVWDAISDPLVGYLSDKTNTKWGRRRPWILASTLPIALSFWMISAPPESITDATLIIWMAVAVILFYSAQTIFVVPHLSLGAELSDDYHERNKIFGFRHAGWIAGYIIALGTMNILIQTEQNNVDATRAVAAEQAIIAGAATMIGLIICFAFIAERPDFQGRGAEKPWRAIKDIWQNKHARTLLFVNFIETIGIAAVTILTLYYAQYVMKAAILAPLFILSFMVFSFLLVPIWMPIAKKIGKKRVWIASLIVSGIAFAGIGILSPGQNIELMIFAGIAGAANGCGGMISPSIKSDIIDYDEYLTGERKEGSYFAAWNFVAKSAYGVMLMVTGFALSWAGFVPRADQAEPVINTLRFLYGGIPLIAYTIGAILMYNFSLNEAEHNAIRDKINARSTT